MDFKSNDFGTAHSKGLADAFLVTAYSKGVARADLRQSVAGVDEAESFTI